MSFEYDPAISRSIDRVRLLTGDTDAADPQLQDEEIAYILSDEGNQYAAAAFCAELIGAKYARLIDTEVQGRVRRSYIQLQENYAGLAARLRRKAARMGVIPYAGGISEGDKESAADNADRVAPVFTREMETESGTEIPSQEPPISFPIT